MRSESEMSQRMVGVNASAGRRVFGGFGTGRVIGVGLKQILLDRTPLSPSRPNCAGDQGTIDGVVVVDVIEEDDGFLHVLDEHMELELGTKVHIWRDPIRRDRLERTHAAAVVCLAELFRQRAAVASAEIVAGLTWIETVGPVPDLDFGKLVKDDQEIEILARRAGRMAVFLGDRIIDTVDAPIAARTGDIAGAEVSAIAALDAGHEALEIALPDEDGKRWWR